MKRIILLLLLASTVSASDTEVIDILRDYYQFSMEEDLHGYMNLIHPGSLPQGDYELNAYKNTVNTAWNQADIIQWSISNEKVSDNGIVA